MRQTENAKTGHAHDARRVADLSESDKGSSDRRLAPCDLAVDVLIQHLALLHLMRIASYGC